MVKKPIVPPSPDGIYPRCVYCRSEVYMPAVIDYSEGRAILGCCDLPLPKSHVKTKREDTDV